MKILLVEDERDLSQAIQRVLGFQKYDVDTAFDGLTGLEMATSNNYDLVVLDIMLPKLNGFDFVKKIRNDKNNVPILVLTARNEIDDKVLALDLGADDYLTKPFQVKELIARIRALIRRKDSASSKSSNFGNTILDYNNFSLIGPKKEVRLTSKEFKIIDLLLNEQNKFISTEIIMERVWDYDSPAEINVVWVFLSAIRKKLSEIGSNYTIIAERGIGYKIGEIK